MRSNGCIEFQLRNAVSIKNNLPVFFDVNVVAHELRLQNP